jgi:hypothetical protein
VHIKPRRILLLHKPSTLSKEESWLRKAYANIVFNLMQFTISAPPVFDPFSAKYYGLESVQYNKYDYHAFLEVTSYFWASKGGRGALLEKVIAVESGPNSTNGVLLAQIPQLLEHLKGVKERNQWQLARSAPKLKFDLVNIIDNRIIFLEIKNRVDSGGTAAREEALAKKFLTLSKIIQDGEKVFVKDNTTEMDIAQVLLEHGIKELEMHVGFLFSIDGNEATIESDKAKGFYGASRLLLTNYYQKQNHRYSVKLDYDQSLQRLSFEKDGLVVSVDHLYGSDVTRKFTRGQLTISAVLRNVFTRKWDDIWLALNLAISQRALLLEYGTNHIREIKNIKETEPHNSDFESYYRRFADNQEDIQSLSECVRIIKEKANIRKLPIPSSSVADSLDTQLADCIYVYAAYTSHKKLRSTSLKGLTDQESVLK